MKRQILFHVSIKTKVINVFLFSDDLAKDVKRMFSCSLAVYIYTHEYTVVKSSKPKRTARVRLYICIQKRLQFSRVNRTALNIAELRLF